MAKFAVESGRSFEQGEGSVDTPEVKQFMRQAAAGAVVLLKNDRELLPISSNTKKISVFGQNASIPTPTGGGSASLSASYIVSPLEAITKAAKEFGAEVEYSMGAEVYAYIPLINQYLVPLKKGGSVATLEIWKPSNSPSNHWLDDTPSLEAECPPDLTTPQESANVFPFDGQFQSLGVTGQCNRVSSRLVMLAIYGYNTSSLRHSYPMRAVTGSSVSLPVDTSSSSSMANF